MKRILFILFFLSSICCFSQVNDSFSDRNFTVNPTWIGTVDKFIIAQDYGLEHDAYGLQLHDVEAGDAYLSTPSALLRGTTWQFKVFFYGFKPTSKSYLRFYLASSQTNLLGSLDGYYLLFGGRNRNISFLSQKGTESQTLIEGKSSSLSNSLCTALIKITCSESGVWSLSAKIDDNDWQDVGNVTDKTFTQSNYAGVACKYSAFSSDKVYLDDVLIVKTGIVPGGDDKPTEPEKPDPEQPVDPEQPTSPEKPDSSDKTPPKVLAIKLEDRNTISIDFNEAITVYKAYFYVERDDYKIPVKCLVSKFDSKRLTLTLSSPLEDEKDYELICTGIEDLNGNRMEMFSELLSFHENTFKAVSFGSIVFNEIMANPNDVKGLPESEYIELYNRTTDNISLKRANIVCGGKCYPLPDLTISAQGYLILCAQKSVDMWQTTGVSVVGVPAFPSLVNTGKLLWLEDEQGGLLAWVDYSDNWYKDTKKKHGGWSLECIDSNNLSGEIDNWQATLDEKGGTPSQKNSVAHSLPDEKEICVQSCFMQTADTMVVNFSKAMNVYSLAEKSNYQVLNKDVSLESMIIDYPCGRNVKLVFSAPLAEEEILKLELHDLMDVSGNRLAVPIEVTAQQPQTVNLGDIQFNELLFNPFSGGACYIELANLSNKTILLNQLKITLGKSDGDDCMTVPLSSLPKIFPPHSLLFLTSHVQQVSAHYKCDPLLGIELDKFPKLSPQGGTLCLLSEKGETIDKMDYSESMHTTSQKDKRGISLEKKSEELPSSDASSWLSASFLSGYGTPGALNKCSEQLSPDEKVGFWLEKRSFSPSSSQNNRLQLLYSFPEDGYVANVRIYEASGREVCVLTNNQAVLAQGMMEWEGKESNGQLCRVGLYVVYVELHNAAGRVEYYKLPFAIVG